MNEYTASPSIARGSAFCTPRRGSSSVRRRPRPPPSPTRSPTSRAATTASTRCSVIEVPGSTARRRSELGRKSRRQRRQLPVINAAGNLIDENGNTMNGAFKPARQRLTPGFPGFGPINASQTLAYMADMQETGVPVTYGYISDIHGNEHSRGAHRLQRRSGCAAEAEIRVTSPRRSTTTRRSRRSSSVSPPTGSPRPTRCSSSARTRVTTTRGRTSDAPCSRLHRHNCDGATVERKHGDTGVAEHAIGERSGNIDGNLRLMATEQGQHDAVHGRDRQGAGVLPHRESGADPTRPCASSNATRRSLDPRRTRHRRLSDDRELPRRSGRDGNRAHHQRRSGSYAARSRCPQSRTTSSRPGTKDRRATHDCSTTVSRQCVELARTPASPRTMATTRPRSTRTTFGFAGPGVANLGLDGSGRRPGRARPESTAGRRRCRAAGRPGRGSTRRISARRSCASRAEATTTSRTVG